MCNVASSDNYSPSLKQNIIRILGSHCVDIYGNRYADTQYPSHTCTKDTASGLVSRKEIRKAAGW